MDNILRWVDFQGMGYRFFLIAFLIIYRMVYTVLGNFLKKDWPYMWGWNGAWKQVSASPIKNQLILKFLINQVSYISQPKKMNTISHVRQTDGLTNCQSWLFVS